MEKRYQNKLTLDKLKSSDISIIVNAFQQANWPKPASIFEQYLNEQQMQKRVVWVAYVDKTVAGYITLNWNSQYTSFANAGIPEIMDLNVLPSFRKAGIASRLVKIAEKEVAKKGNIIGLGVGLYGGPDGGYGAAQKLYVKLGYIPDGKGVTYMYKHSNPGSKVLLDDNLILWLTKTLK